MIRTTSMTVAGLLLAVSLSGEAAAESTRLLEDAAGPQLAQASPLHQRLFGTIDGSGDASIGRDEYMAYRGQVFGGMDADGDRALDQEEFMAGGRGGQTMTRRHRMRREEMFRILNRSGSGAISRSEWGMEGEEHFNLRDRNGDGRVTPDEFGSLMRHGMPM